MYPSIAVSLRKKAPRKPMGDWGDAQGYDKAFAAQALGPEFKSSETHRKLGLVAHICNSSVPPMT